MSQMLLIVALILSIQVSIHYIHVHTCDLMCLSADPHVDSSTVVTDCASDDHIVYSSGHPSSSSTTATEVYVTCGDATSTPLATDLTPQSVSEPSSTVEVHIGMAHHHHSTNAPVTVMARANFSDCASENFQSIDGTLN